MSTTNIDVYRGTMIDFEFSTMSRPILIVCFSYIIIIVYLVYAECRIRQDIQSVVKYAGQPPVENKWW